MALFTNDARVLTGDASLQSLPTAPTSVTTLPALFQHQAKHQPETTAYSSREEGKTRTTTYFEADQVAASIASRLLRTRINTGDRAPVVAIWLEKGLDLILSILATTYSGATWLPFDPDVPVERAAVCILETGADVLITDSVHANRVLELQERTSTALAAVGKQALRCHFAHDLIAAARMDRGLHPLTAGPRPEDAAYIIMTSGTTGTPKGIAISHSAALAFSLSEQRVLETSPSDIVWNGFSPAFDMFIEEMWVTIAGGGQLAIGTRQECMDVPNLPTVWADRGVTIVNAVPTLIGIMDLARCDTQDSLLPPSIRLVNVGGEACPPSLAGRLARPGLRILNTYGPTETTVTATWDELEPDTLVTIGKPLPGYHACLLPILEDGALGPRDPLEITDGAEGELAIGGPCVGIGYIGRPELTAQKFIPHPLAPTSVERLYLTGDRVKLQADRKIVFLGRIDTQVKHRGFRIELGEIESQLYQVSGVQAAAVILANSGTDKARLEAFVVAASNVTLDDATLQNAVSEHLPAYMRPEEIFFLSAEEMPRLTSGKINAKALHEVSSRKAAARVIVTAINDDSISGRSSCTQPDSTLDVLLDALEALFPQAGHIKPDADIFDNLGGHSLLVAMLVSRLRKYRTPDSFAPFAAIGLADIYEGRTAANIAARFIFTKDLADSDSEDVDGEHNNAAGPNVGDHLSVPQWKFVLCGVAQILPLLFLFFVHAVEILAPYLVFDYFTAVRKQIGWAVLSAYGLYVVTPPCLAILAIAAKWLLLGRVQPGEYPLYGTYYFRWWVAERFAALVDAKLIADSALYPMFLRAMGAKVGKCCHLGALALGSCADLVEVGNDVVIGAEVNLAVCVVERGRLILKKVTICNDVIIDSKCVIEGGASIGEAAELAALTLVPDGVHVPAFQRYHGSPARFDRIVDENAAGLGRKTRPSAARAAAMVTGNLVIAWMILPLLYYLPQIPGLLLFDYVDIRSVTGWDQVAILAVPIALAYQCLIFVQLLICRYAFLGRQKEGKYRLHSFWYLRKWYVERLMDLALTVLHPVFATLYIVPFLRLLGVKIGKRAEVSTARSMPFELLEIGEESFVADAVVLGSAEVRGNEITLKKTTLEARAFAGNASVLPQGTTLASGTLLGVLSIAPPATSSMAKNSSCFGSPPVLLPNRQRAEGHADNLLFRPSGLRIAARLTIEGLRIVLPRALIIFGLGFSLQLAHDGYDKIGAWTLLTLPLFYIFLFALPALFFTALLKWTLIGRYKPAEWPLWSLNVWLSEAVTSTWETIAEPLLANMLVGTPYLAWCFRLMGVKVGSRVTLLSSDVTEYDCVSIADEAVINEWCGAQTHLFEDRIMKVGRVAIGRRACLKPYSICLPGSTVSDGAQLGCLSLLMKNECLPEGTAWEGAPVGPRKQRTVNECKPASVVVRGKESC